MSDPAGRLKIQLQRSPAGIRCAIRSSRPLTASSMLEGRSSAEVASLLPLLYSICAKAQSCACVGALEAALGLSASPKTRSRRQLTVTLETIREHLWRMLLDWPRLCGETPQREPLAALVAQVRALFSLADPASRLFRPGGDAAALDESTWSQGCSSVESLIIEQLLGRPIDAWLREVIDHDSLRHWAETTATGPARLLRSLIEADESALGSCAVAALPELDNDTLAACLMGPEAARFIAQPHWDGVPHETSPLSRRAGSALIRALRVSHGNGLLTRLSAQILEVARLMVALRQPGPEDAALASDANAPMPGVGIGLAEAARGRLVHLARLENDRVLDYRILAPTEWNFHARGPVAMGLAAMPDSEDSALRRRAELLIMAIDPCVAYDLTIVSGTSKTCVPG